MKVVAVKSAFINGRMVTLGDEIDIPYDTKGKWFAPADSEAATIAKQIRAFNCTTPEFLNSRAAGLDQLRNHLRALQKKGTFSSFNEMMKQDTPLSFGEHVKAKK